jgi:hypothetical protein
MIKLLTLPRILFVLVLVVGTVLFLKFLKAWPWSSIGVILAFAGVLVMLLRDSIKSYGESHTSEVAAEAGLKPFARLVEPNIFAIGVPLVILGALFQIFSDPADKTLLHGENIPEKIVYLPLNANSMSIDMSKLDQALHILQTNQQSIRSDLEGIVNIDLLLVNCGTAAECSCPQGWGRVKDTGRWNLNAGVKGDSITLCSQLIPAKNLVR